MTSTNPKIAALATDDYQKRGDKYPAGGKPDMIDVFNNDVVVAFKNTSEREAIRWTENFLRVKGFVAKTVIAQQTGDYQDDWVEVHAEGLVEITY